MIKQSVQRGSIRISSYSLLAALILGIVFSLIPTPVQAATYTVTNINDKGTGSLRQMITSATAGSTIKFDPSLAGKTIVLTSGALSISKSLTIEGLGSGQLTISGNKAYRVLNITGTAPVVKITGLTIANGYVKLLRGAGINNTAKLTLDDVVVRDNVIASTGTGILGISLGAAGIYNSGTLTVTRSTIQNNHDVTTSMGGGGIYNDGTLTVSDSTITGNVVRTSKIFGYYGGGGVVNRKTATITRTTISQNTATGFTYGGGGGIYNEGTLTLTHSLLTGNQAPGTFGAGIMNFPDAVLTVEDTTFTGNVAGSGGGAIENFGTLTLTRSSLTANQALSPDYGGGGLDNTGDAVVTNVTFSGNSAVAGGGVLNSGGTLSLNFATLAGNTATTGGAFFSEQRLDGATTITDINNTILAYSPAGGDCVVTGGTFTTQTTLIMDNTCAPALSGDPLLGPLQNNGGETDTYALLPGSPALDQAVCGAVIVDQRGTTRPFDLPDVPNLEAGCDLGAFELQP